MLRRGSIGVEEISHPYVYAYPLVRSNISMSRVGPKLLKDANRNARSNGDVERLDFVRLVCPRGVL